MSIETLIRNNPIRIISGEGLDVPASIEDYGGYRSLPAIRARLTRERCGGDRWATGLVWSHQVSTNFGAAVNVESGEWEPWPVI